MLSEDKDKSLYGVEEVLHIETRESKDVISVTSNRLEKVRSLNVIDAEVYAKHFRVRDASALFVTLIKIGR